MLKYYYNGGMEKHEKNLCRYFDLVLHCEQEHFPRLRGF